LDLGALVESSIRAMLRVRITGVPQTLDDYFDSHYRRIVYIAAEFAIGLVGVVIAWFIVPQLRSDAAPELPLLAEILLRIYPAIVVLFFLHAAASGVVIPRLRGSAFAIWIVSGIALPLALVFMPFVAYSVVYGALIEGLG